jgi:hypothetical protein
MDLTEVGRATEEIRAILEHLRGGRNEIIVVRIGKFEKKRKEIEEGRRFEGEKMDGLMEYGGVCILHRPQIPLSSAFA